MKPFFVILFFFFCLYGFTKLFGPLPLTFNNANNVFTVQGTGEIAGTGQTANVSLGVSITAGSVQEAQTEVNQKVNQIVTDIKALGVQDKDIKTTNYSSSPVDQSLQPVVIQSKPPTSGQQYTVSEDVEVTAPTVDLANKVMDTATTDGATNIGGVQFNLSDQIQKELQNQARVKAIADAKEKAQKIAKESGLRLGQLLSVEDNSGPYPVYMDAKAANVSTMNQSTNLQPGQNKVQVTVTLTYQTY